MHVISHRPVGVKPDPPSVNGQMEGRLPRRPRYLYENIGTDTGFRHAGVYKDMPVDMIEKRPDGSQRIRFRSVSAEDTPEYTWELVELRHEESRE